MTTPRVPFILFLSCVLGILMSPDAVEPVFAQVTASGVMDRSSLRAFVDRAADLSEAEVSDADDAYAFFDRTFRPEGAWRQGPIYLYVFETDGVNVFHGGNKTIEGQNVWEWEDKNGVKYTQELLREAAGGGGFVEYYFDNPNVTGDEEEGSLKVGYATELDLGGTTLVIGSGFYPADAVPIAPPLAQLLLALLLGGGAYWRWRQRP